MAARDILVLVAVVFLAAAIRRCARDGWRLAPASRTWLMVACLFGAVAAWLGWMGVGRI